MKEKIQSFGRFLSGMVMPNIGAFIAWGLLTALFIDTGWLPNEQLSSMVDPMIKYVLPLLIAYQGGKMVGGQRGAVMGAIMAVGVICGNRLRYVHGRNDDQDLLPDGLSSSSTRLLRVRSLQDLRCLLTTSQLVFLVFYLQSLDSM